MVVIEKHAHKEFITAAIADGWTAANGPWDYYEDHDLSVTLTKHFPSFGGSVMLWMINRNIGVTEWSDEQTRWVRRYPEGNWSTSVQAWIKSDSGGEHGLGITLEDILRDGLSEKFWNALANTCDSCGEVVEKLHHVAFANKSCSACLPEMQRKLERPGWYN